MPSQIITAVTNTPKAGFTIFTIIKKYWYLIILLIVLLPSVIISIQVAIKTNNPTYPFFDLSTRILTADIDLDNVITQIEENPDVLTGMNKPTEGAWNNIKYIWRFFWKITYRIIGDIWLIFFPLYIIFKIIHYSGNISIPARNFTKSFFIFLLYLFITNTIILIYNLSTGNTEIIFEEGTNKFMAYLLISLKILPFHGIYHLITYLVGLNI